jgi:drug/metabolite transporter (DMT)-like permease
MTVVSYYEMMNLNQDFSIFPFSFPGTSDLVFLLILSILCTTLAFTLSVEILKKIDPLTVIITNNLEPIYGVVFSVLLFKDSEIMSGTFYIGAGILLLSIFSYPFIKRKLQQKEKPVEETSLQA